MTGPTFRRPPTAHEAVVTHIRRNILEGKWKPGEFIRPERLAAHLGVSRVPIREALRTLQADGLVQYHPHRGHAVTTLEIEDVRDIYRIRQLIEQETARYAIQNVTEQHLAQMREAMLEMEAVDRTDIAILTAANRRFHFALFEAADRPRLLEFLSGLWDSSDMHRSLYYLEHDELDEVNREHRSIYNACEERNESLVLDLLAEHLDHAISLLERVLSEEDSQSN